MDSITKADTSEIVRGLKLILDEGQVTELRVLDAITRSDRRPQVFSGYFDDPEKLAKALESITKAKAFYFVPNVVNPALLARANNRLRPAGKEPTTADHDIERRRWLLIDVDAKRPAGISANDQEHDAAIELVYHMRAELSGENWPEPIVADSGNGAHLLYKIDLPGADGGLVKRCLEALAARFKTDQVHIDTSVHNPARIWKLYGTVSAKGDSTPERPHRQSTILEAPGEIALVTDDQLKALACKVTTPPAAPNLNGINSSPSFDIDGWIARHGLVVEGPEPWQGGRKWVFPTCPWNGDHVNRSAYVLQMASGAIAAGCHHNGCQGHDWHALRDAVEPGWRDSKRSLKAAVPLTNKPEPIPSRPFPVHALPPAVANYIREAAMAIGCDPSYVALPLLACLARAIGNTRAIRLKRTWQELPIIWGAIVGKSGTHKSPAIQLATVLLERKQAEAMTEYVEAMARYEQERAQYERDFAAWKRSKSTEPPPWEPKEPSCRRYICGDITIEALADRLDGQTDGVVVVRDELAGWLDGLAEYKGGRGSDTGHWLACWSGAPMTVDRKSGAKKMIHIPRAAVSIVGGIQPGIFARAIRGEHMKDGMCARLLLTMPSPRAVKWTEATVSPAAEAALSAVIDRLLTLEPAADEEGKPAPFGMPLTPEAKLAWIAYFDRHRAKMPDLDDDLAAAWSKLEAYAARFALIVQLCSWAEGNGSVDHVDQLSIEAGVELADWFGNEARRVYGLLVETEDERDDRELVELINRKGGRITPRQLAHTSTQYRAPGAAEAALEKLIKAGHGRWQVDHATGGRPANVFVLSDHDEARNVTEPLESPTND